MASWKLIVEDYGKIKSAEIEIAPLTMFVGDNNSGKSYLLALLWGIEKFGVEALIGEYYVDTEEIKTLIDWLCMQLDIAIEKQHYEVSLDVISDMLDKVLNIELKKNKNNLVRRIFNSNNVEIGSLSIKFYDLKESILCFNMKSDFLTISINGERGFAFGKNILDDKIYRDFNELQWFLLEGVYSLLLDISMDEDDMDNSIYLPAARTGFMLTKDIINKTGRKNTFNLSEEKESVTPFLRPINQFLDIMGDISAEFSGSKEKLKLALDLENEMVNGSIKISVVANKEVQYVPDGYKKGIALRLSSAVVTELAPFILILKHKNNIRRFYYEEPEMCLHPQLQHKMGKMIGRAVNSGIGMIITTHSDIIMQHINNMIKLAQRKDCEEICKNLGYSQLDLLSHQQIKVYQLKTKIRGKTEVEELFCGENGFKVPTFNTALDNIMDETYEIQG